MFVSLHVYRSADEVPKGIRVVTNNDLFFNARTSIKNNDLTSDILSTIDKARYNSEFTFIGRTPELGALNKSMLSTGAKTLLNIISYPNVCFDTVCCGDNALEFIPKIKDGHAIWEIPVLAYTGSPDCDMEYGGIHYTDFYKFLHAVEREERD